ncbi:MAG: hypothetical protein ACRDTT_36325, partial [Pseudonocardiaceae bacterium]
MASTLLYRLADQRSDRPETLGHRQSWRRVRHPAHGVDHYTRRGRDRNQARLRQYSERAVMLVETGQDSGN